MPLLAETVVNSSGRLTPKVINTARITDAELQEVVDER